MKYMKYKTDLILSAYSREFKHLPQVKALRDKTARFHAKNRPLNTIEKGYVSGLRDAAELIAGLQS